MFFTVFYWETSFKWKYSHDTFTKVRNLILEAVYIKTFPATTDFFFYELLNFVSVILSLNDSQYKQLYKSEKIQLLRIVF